MRTFCEDFKVGTESEYNSQSVLETYFNQLLVRTPPYSPFDYEGTHILIELKTRTNLPNKYPTTMIPTSKCIAADTLAKQVHFVFKFSDGSLWTIAYDKKLFDTFERDQFQRQDRADHRDKKQSYTYIPIGFLKKIYTEHNNTI